MISLHDLSVSAGDFHLKNINLEIQTGEYCVLMGKTGCGKTTILETVCGLKSPQAGIVKLMGRDVTYQKPAMRGIGYVPQDGALFSTMTIRHHLGFALAIRKRPEREIEARVDELAKLLGIEHLLSRRPFGLSGGERQRVALGRALACRPDVLCLDEPLSALDEDTHDEMCDLLKSVCKHHRVTTLHVTHSLREARLLADRILRMENGNVVTHTISELDEEMLEHCTREGAKPSTANRTAP